MDRLSIVLPPHRRRRRPVQKSTLGCAKCKARKIKCDESKPSCLRCREKGLKCPGVATGPKIRWSTKHEKHEAKQISSKVASLLSPFENDSAGFISPPQSESLLQPATDEHSSSREQSHGNNTNAVVCSTSPPDIPLEPSDIIDFPQLLDETTSDALMASLFPLTCLAPCEPSESDNIDRELLDTGSSALSQFQQLDFSASLYPSLFDMQSELIGA
ncbi:hypothetical protein BJY00DRAFT_308049 [Aspergillus carlsbadensis]|nr:hypothetical protein BJY00DRAFT_308049 [Aspergillus carlsbadensis]